MLFYCCQTMFLIAKGHCKQGLLHRIRNLHCTENMASVQLNKKEKRPQPANPIVKNCCRGMAAFYANGAAMPKKG